jgi:hypothetical protein
MLTSLPIKQHSGDMWKGCIVALGLACFSGCFASAEEVGTLVFGVGARSCAYWQSSSELAYLGNAWVQGFWTAMNLSNGKNHAVGSQTDAAGILAEVKKTCAEAPSETLDQATLYTYRRMENKQNFPRP